MDKKIIPVVNRLQPGGVMTRNIVRTQEHTQFMVTRTNKLK